MAKVVQNSSMVAHLWANQSQEEARTSSSNLYFRRDTIYSYGEHFPIARIVSLRGRTAVLFNTASYSNTSRWLAGPSPT